MLFPDNQTPKILSQVFTGNGQSKRLVLALPTAGCRWVRAEKACIHCPSEWVMKRHDMVNDPVSAIAELFSEYKWKDIKEVCIYSTGSVVDQREIPVETLKEILRLVSSQLSPVFITIESRPELLLTFPLRDVVRACATSKLCISIPIESRSEVVRKKIGKTFSNNLFCDVVKMVRAYGALFNTSVLIKPPGLTEQEAFDDAVETVFWVANYEPTQVTVEPMHIFPNTLLERSFLSGHYRPPSLWTVSAVLMETKGLPVQVGGEFLYPEPVAKPTSCPHCYEKVLEWQRRWPSSATDGLPKCSCINKWEDLVHERTSKLIFCAS